MTSEPIGGEFAIFWSVTTDEPLTESEVLTRASPPALGSRHDDYHDFELVNISAESKCDILKWKIHLTYRKANMYEKLIEALREEARRWEAGMTPAYTGDLQDALNRVADRLEGGDQGKVARFIIQGGEAGCKYNIPVTDRDLDGKTRVVNLSDHRVLSADDHARSLGIQERESPNDDDEPLTTEWLEAAQPAILAADDDCIIALCRMPACGRVTMAISGSAATLEYVTTRGDYRALRRMLGIPMGDG